MLDSDAQSVLDFWFGPPTSPQFAQFRDIWFSSGGGPAFDEACRARCAGPYRRAVEGRCDHWVESPRGCLALIILFDQIPRNIFRGQARSFATDERAVAVARRVVDRGWDRGLSDVERLFVYLPFEHSENLEDQRRSVALHDAMPDSDRKEGWVKYARQHLEIIERFGRFPHRNVILRRESTPEEVAFLEETGLHFGTAGHGASK